MLERDLIKILESLGTHKKKKKKIRKYIETIYEETGSESVRIHNVLQDKFSSVSKDNSLRKYLVDISTIERWIHPPLDLEKIKIQKPNLYPYLQKIQLVHDALFSTEPNWYTRPLPNLFVTHAERCLYRFNDPLGEKVDLYAQYLVIREYWRRDTKGEQTKDLDFMLDNTTWLYDDENLENTPYYKTIEKEPKQKPYIRWFGHKNKLELQYRVYDFLGISFILPKKKIYKKIKELKIKSIYHEVIWDYSERQAKSKPLYEDHKETRMHHLHEDE